MVFGAVLGRVECVQWTRQQLRHTDGESEVAQRVKIRPGVSLETICEVVRREYGVTQDGLREKWRRDHEGRDVVVYLVSADFPLY